MKHKIKEIKKKKKTYEMGKRNGKKDCCATINAHIYDAYDKVALPRADCSTPPSPPLWQWLKNTGTIMQDYSKANKLIETMLWFSESKMLPRS